MRRDQFYQVESDLDLGGLADAVVRCVDPERRGRDSVYHIRRGVKDTDPKAFDYRDSDAIVDVVDTPKLVACLRRVTDNCSVKIEGSGHSYDVSTSDRGIIDTLLRQGHATKAVMHIPVPRADDVTESDDPD